VEEMIQREEGFKMRLLENKIKRHAQMVRGAEASDILPGEGRRGFQEMQDDMLQGKTNVGLEQRESLKDLYPERSLYLDNVMEGDADKDKGKCHPEEQLSKSLSAPSPLPTVRKNNQAQDKWLEEYDQYFTDPVASSAVPPRSDQSWVYGQGPELSSEVYDIEDRLRKRYRDQQRKAILMGDKFGPAITGAVQRGKTYTPGRRMNYREGVDYNRIQDFLDDERRRGQQFLQNKRLWEKADTQGLLADSDIVHKAADLYRTPEEYGSGYSDFIQGLAGSHGAELAAEKLGYTPRLTGSSDRRRSQRRTALPITTRDVSGTFNQQPHWIRTGEGWVDHGFDPRSRDWSGGKKKSLKKINKTLKKKRSKKKLKGGRKQDWEKNKGFFGPIMDKKGVLDRDEICHYCTTGAFVSNARKFCKLHDKTWDSKSNKCLPKKKNKRSKRSNRRKDIQRRSKKNKQSKKKKEKKIIV